ncbi:MAG: hypothetical protein ACYC6Y_09700 [Thermoguttaceae bacterium]
MTESSSERTGEDEMLCPACKACQAWSDECRRCKCDLSLLKEWHAACEAVRRRCLVELGRGSSKRALRYARRYALLAGGAEASRLLGVCQLLSGNWAESCASLGEGTDPR